METIADKKRRAPNFSTSEKTLLLHLVGNFKDVIENKKTDSQTWKQKDLTWDKITKLFNSQNSQNICRSKDSLKKFYDNLKKNARKCVAEEKREITKTGGGQTKISSSKDPNIELCLSIMNRKTVFGLENPYDGDAMQSTMEAEILDGCSKSVSHEKGNSINNTLLESQPSISELPEVISIDDHNYSSCEHEAQEGIQSTSFEEQDLSGVNTEADWTKVAASHLKHKITDSLQHSWSKRRRPSLKQPNSELEAEYIALGKSKLSFFEKEKETIERRNEREEEIFKLKRKKLELDIKIRELELLEKQKMQINQ